MNDILAAGTRVIVTFADRSTAFGFVFPRRTGRINPVPGSEAWDEKPQPRGTRDELGQYLVQDSEGRDRLDRNGFWSWLVHESNLAVCDIDLASVA